MNIAKIALSSILLAGMATSQVAYAANATRASGALPAAQSRDSATTVTRATPRSVKKDELVGAIPLGLALAAAAAVAVVAGIVIVATDGGNDSPG